MDNLTFYLGFMIIAGLFLYFSGRNYLREAFQSVMFLTPEPGDVTNVNLPDRPYTTRRINKLADYNDGFQNDSYELDAVYNNEGSRVAGKREISDAMTPKTSKMFRNAMVCLTAQIPSNRELIPIKVIANRSN